MQFPLITDSTQRTFRRPLLITTKFINQLNFLQDINHVYKQPLPHPREHPAAFSYFHSEFAPFILTDIIFDFARNKSLRLCDRAYRTAPADRQMTTRNLILQPIPKKRSHSALSQRTNSRSMHIEPQLSLFKDVSQLLFLHSMFCFIFILFNCKLIHHALLWEH